MTNQISEVSDLHFTKCFTFTFTNQTRSDHDQLCIQTEYKIKTRVIVYPGSLLLSWGGALACPHPDPSFNIIINVFMIETDFSKKRPNSALPQNTLTEHVQKCCN